MTTSLYGREYELGWLRNRVLRLTRDSNFSVLILLYGESGIGKTALLNAFVAETLERHKGTVVFFQPERAAGMLGVELFAESLFRSAHATPGPWGVAASRLGEQFAQQHANLLHSAAPASAAYSAKGVVPGVNTGERILAGDPHRLQLGVLCRDILLSMVDNVTSINGLSSQHLSLIFCFDQFSDYSPPVKQWLGSVLLRTLQQEERLASPKIVVTGSESMELAGQRDYWEVPQIRMEEFELLPIGRSACIKWLIDRKIDTDLIDEVMERSKGVPGRICEILADGKMVSSMARTVANEESGSGFSTRQKRWLHAATTLEYVDREGLSVLLGEREAVMAFQWLRELANSEGITLVDRADPPHIFFSAGLKRKILAEISSRYPDRMKDFQRKIAVQQALQQKVPSTAHREYLKHLVAIEPFNLAMIEKIYGHDK